MRKYINIALGVLIGCALVAAGFGIAGNPIPGMTNIIVILAMIVLILNATLDIKAGKDKGFPIFLMVIAALAIITNAISLVMDIMGIE